MINTWMPHGPYIWGGLHLIFSSATRQLLTSGQTKVFVAGPIGEIILGNTEIESASQPKLGAAWTERQRRGTVMFQNGAKRRAL